ncbi:MAG TPA: Ig-like domain-containing protein [Gemmatimonadaceae bacterium]
MRILPCAALAIILVGGCSHATKPTESENVASLSLPSTSTAVQINAQTQLVLSARDAAGNPLANVKATWVSSAESIAAVSNTGVVTGVGYGTASIVATVGSHSASADVVVTGPPVPRSYSVLDLGASLQVGSTVRQLSDSGDVVADRYYRRGVATSIPGCSGAVALNGPGHVLCRTSVYDSVSSFAIWRDGTLVPLTAADTFKAGDFRAFAISDSDEVAGMFWRPSFTNAKCPASGDRCLAIWKDGVASFPGYTAATDDAMLMNGKHQVVMEQPMWAPSSPGLSTTIYDVSTGARTSVLWGIFALNDNGWAAIERPTVQPGSPSTSGSAAIVTTTASSFTLGKGGATGINNANVAVGTLDVGAFIWHGGGIALLTNASIDPSWTITAADEINNRGQILATADNSDGRRARTVLLTPAQP